MGVERVRRVFGTPESPARLIVIRAAAGRGKTTAIRRWVTTLNDAVVIWPNAAPAPRSDAAFWTRALTQLHSHGLLEDRLLTRATATPSAVRAILAEGLAAVDERTTLVIDSLRETVPDTMYRKVVEGIASLLETDSRLQIVVIERGPSALDDIELSDDARLDLDAADLVSFTTDFGATAAEATALHRPLHELLPDPSERTSAGLCALVPALDEELTRLITGRADAHSVLDRFASARLGSWLSGSPDEPRFAFWPRVREEALGESRRTRPAQVRAVARRLARWYVALDDHSSALAYAITSEDTSLIDHVALRSFPDWIALDHAGLATISTLPKNRVRASAVISMRIGIEAELTGRPAAESHAHFQAAIDATRGRTDMTSPSEQLILIGIESYAYRRIGSAVHAISTALRFKRRAHALLAARRFDESLAHAYAALAYQVGVTLILGDVVEHDHAAELLDDLADFCHARGIDDYRNSALAARSYLLALAGRMAQSEELALSVDDSIWPAPWIPDSARSFHMLSGAVRAALAADLVTMRRELHAFASSTPRAEYEDLLQYGTTFVDLAAGNVRAARVRFDQTVASRRARRVSKPSVVRRLWYLRHVLALLGDAPQSLGARPPGAANDPLALALGAAIDLNRGDIERATTKVTKATARARTPFTQHIAFVVLARLGAACADHETLHGATSHLLVLLNSHGLRLGFGLLSDSERAKMLAVLGDAEHMRVAFQAVRASPLANGSHRNERLSVRELTVIRSLAVHGDRLEVARDLHLAPGTVKTHLRAIYRKLNVHSEHEALRKAAASGLLHSPLE